MITVLRTYTQVSRISRPSRLNLCPTGKPSNAFRTFLILRPSPTHVYRERIRHAVLDPVLISHAIIHTSSRQQASDPKLVVFPAISVGAEKLVKVWCRRRSPETKSKFYIFVTRSIWLGLGIYVALIAVFYAANIVETPITKRKRFLAFSRSQCAKIYGTADKKLDKLRKHRILPVSHPSAQRVLRIVNSIVSANSMVQQVQGTKWDVIVIDQPGMRGAAATGTQQIRVFKVCCHRVVSFELV